MLSAAIYTINNNWECVDNRCFDELIRINMSFGIDSETASLTGLMRQQAKYGSTANHVIADQKTKYITHMVSSNDTLQGLALKYEVSIEQIKRANKLWSSDNLSLRSRTTLNIPLNIPKLCETRNNATTFDSSSNDSSCTPSPKLNLEQSISSQQSTNCNTSSLECEDIPLDDETASQHNRFNRRSNSKLKNGFKMASLILPDEHQSKENDDLGYVNTDEDESAADFLIRIDSSIAKTKDKVKNMQQNRISGTHSDDDLFRLHQPHHRSGLRRHHSQTSRSRANSATNSSSLNDINNLPQPLVMTHGRKVISSMKRLEKAQDEIFEL